MPKGRTIYLQHMCDHTRVMAAAIRACGANAEVLPESDQESIDLGRRHTTGKECLPMAITLGDFLKKANEQGFNPSLSAFFMPTTDGPCRFGQYAKLQKLILKDLGYGDIEMLSFNSSDSYIFKEIGSNDRLFRKLAWQGIVAVDMLEKMLRAFRPYELVKGETDYVYSFSLEKLEREIETGYFKIEEIFRDILYEFEGIKTTPIGTRPVVGIVGEIFVRTNPLCNQGITRKIEKLEGETIVATISEWFLYIGHCFNNASLEDRKYFAYFSGTLDKIYQQWIENRIGNILKDILPDPHEPSIREILGECAPYINFRSHSGEAVLSIGKAINMIKKRNVSGIINILPFSCLPGLIVTAISKKIKEDFNNFPWLNLDYDGTEGGNINTRLEAFLYQVKGYS